MVDQLGEWVVSLTGTDQGRQLAVLLAIFAAIMHASVAAMQKGRFDPWSSRASIDFCYGVMAAPFALFVVPWPEPHVWPVLAAAFLVHTVYKLLMATAFSFGAFTVVYPVVRGTGPLITVLVAGLVFGEVFGPVQWVGVFTLVAGIFGLAIFNLFRISYRRDKLALALLLAAITGFAVAGYTTIDAYGVRSTANPFTFLAWLFFVDGFFMPAAVVLARRGLPKPRLLWKLLRHGLIGGPIAVLSFGSIMLATRLDQVGQAAVLRETSTVFAAIIGWLFLKESVGPVRSLLIMLIAAGALIVEMGG